MAGWISKLINKPKTIQEIEAKTEEVEAEDKLAGVELSLEQKRYATKMLKERGLQPGNFGDIKDSGTWSKIMNWLKTH